MAIYQRGAGAHVAERVQAEPGSPEEKALDKLVAEGEGGWYRVDDEVPAEPGPEDVKPPARSASKADWVAYAVSQGAEQADAESKTRDQLAELFADGGGDS